MRQYLFKTPWWVQKLYPSYLWKMPGGESRVYLTFDDGPHPTITPWVMAELEKYGASATFFCIGKNVVQHPEVYQRIIAAGHAVGNHTYSHQNGWKTNTEAYLDDVKKAGIYIDSALFRPPYGRIQKAQADGLSIILKKADVKVVMWNILSGDFDQSLSPERCTYAVIKGTKPGSIIVFHDSEKAFPNLSIALPAVLKSLSAKGFTFSKL